MNAQNPFAQNPFAPFMKAYTDMASACAFNAQENNPFACSAPSAALQQGYENARKNYQAVSNAARAFADMAQTVSRRQAEFAQQFVEAYSAYLQEISACKNPQDAIRQNACFARKFSENSLANGREFSDIVSKSGSEVAAIINSRLTEALNEVAEATEHATNRATNAFTGATGQQAPQTGSNDPKRKAA